jgi:hypothetical protein
VTETMTTMTIDDLMQDDDTARKAALAALADAGEADRAGLVAGLAERSGPAATALATADAAGESADQAEAGVERAARALGQTGVAQAAAPLTALTRHASKAVRKKAVIGLFSVRTAPARQVLAEALAAEEDDEVRNDLADAIKSAPWAEVAPVALAAARRTAPFSQQLAAAVAASAAAGSDADRAAAAEVLLAQGRSASDADFRVQQRSLQTLDALIRFGGGFPGVADAAGELTGSADPKLRTVGLALRAAAGVDRDAALTELIGLQAKGSQDESASAAVQLRSIPAEIVAQGYAAATTSADPLIRAAAATASVGTVFLARHARVEPLIALLKDASPEVRAAAVTALGKCIPAGKPVFAAHKDAIAAALEPLAKDAAKPVKDALARSKKLLGIA